MSLLAESNSTVEEWMQEVIELFKKEKVHVAYEKLLKHFNNNLEEINWNNYPDVLYEIYKEGKYVNFLLKEFENSDQSNGWELVVDKDEIKTYYKVKEGGLYAAKLEGFINHSIFDVLSIFYEVDLYKTWAPMMTDCKLINSVEQYKFLSYFAFSLPFPFQARDFLSYAYVVDRAEEDQSFLVPIRTLNFNDKFDKTLESISVKVNNTHVRIESEYAGFIVKVIDKNRTWIQIIGSIDPKFSYVPIWLQNLITKNYSYLSIVKFREVAKTVRKQGSEYMKRIKEKSIYKEIAERLANYGHHVDFE
ncbi:hypothetical protein ABK040_005986 [Willaertia magna]